MISINNEIVSPKYQMQLIDDVEKAIWEKYESYKKVRLYLEKWHVVEDDINYPWENFTFKNKDGGGIDLTLTLHTMNGETLLKIAIELGVDTPDFIPSIPTFRNAIKSEYKTASETFEKAFRQIEEHPDIAVGLANSALESIIKEILKDDRIKTKFNPNNTLYDLTSSLLKELTLFPNSDIPAEIKMIGSGLLKASQGIEKLRSEKTNLHGKTTEDYIIKDSIYTYFVVNSVITIGLFLNSYYKYKFPELIEKKKEELDIDDLPF